MSRSIWLSNEAWTSAGSTSMKSLTGSRPCLSGSRRPDVRHGAENVMRSLQQGFDATTIRPAIFLLLGARNATK